MKYPALIVGSLLLLPPLAGAQSNATIDPPSPGPQARLYFSPPSGSFQEGSTFDVSVFLDTMGTSMNAIQLEIRFDPSIMRIVNPTAGKSIIGLWVEPPTYDNTAGTARIIGTIPGGITTSSGLVTTLTFKAIRSGESPMSVDSGSQVLVNDGLGTAARLETQKGDYYILAKPPQGVQVESDTHPFQDEWYNNNSPSLSWTQDAGVTGFSIALDTVPTTIPSSVVNASSTSAAYQGLADGVWYFHIKPRRADVWGAVSSYALHIDTTPPAAFTPTVLYLGSPTPDRFLISFSTTDALSGVDHYEVGVLDSAAPASQSPAFVEAASPYQLPFSSISSGRFLVRAFDKAGNMREESVDIAAPPPPSISFFAFLEHNAMMLLIGALVALLLFLAIEHYMDRRAIRTIETELSHLHHENGAYGMTESEPRVGDPNKPL